MLNSAWKSELIPFKSTLFQKLFSCGLCDGALTKKSCYLVGFVRLDKAMVLMLPLLLCNRTVTGHSWIYRHSRRTDGPVLLTLLWALLIPTAGEGLPFPLSFYCGEKMKSSVLAHVEQSLCQVTNHFPLCIARVWSPVCSLVRGRNNSSDNHEHLVAGRKY